MAAAPLAVVDEHCVLQFIAALREKKGLHEINGTNRGPEIDAWAKEFGSPLGSAWCALFGGHFRKQFGLWVPTHSVGSCDEWVKQAKAAGKWVTKPVLGAAILYTNGEKFTSGPYAGQFDAVHLGHITDLTPGLDCAGNTSDDHGFNRDGGCVAEKPIAWQRVYGYVLP
jgi:hypothetical protein